MNKVLIALMLVVVISTLYISVAAVTDPGYNANLVDNKLKGTTQNIWATIVAVVRVVAVACVVFAGLRYMFASADQKADVKQGMIYLAIGATLIFAATYVIKFIVDAAKQIMQ